MGVPLGVVIERVEDPEPTTEVGLKLLVEPVGNPLTLNETVPLNPFKVTRSQYTLCRFQELQSGKLALQIPKNQVVLE